eukprot:13697176-Alexandrium_andersonii.AAC.1
MSLLSGSRGPEPKQLIFWFLECQHPRIVRIADWRIADWSWRRRVSSDFGPPWSLAYVRRSGICA